MLLFQYFTVLVTEYIVPAIFAFGLIFFIYAIIKYFILGPGEEPVREEGRLYFIKANVWFLLAVVVYVAVFGINSLFNWMMSLNTSFQEDTRVQVVPNVPESR